MYQKDFVAQKYSEITLNDGSKQDTIYTLKLQTLKVYTGIDRYKHMEVIMDFKTQSPHGLV